MGKVMPVGWGRMLAETGYLYFKSELHPEMDTTGKPSPVTCLLYMDQPLPMKKGAGSERQYVRGYPEQSQGSMQ